MRSVIVLCWPAAALLLALLTFWPASIGASTYGGDGGGGYTQLPQCSYSWLNQTLYVQGYFWRCVHDPVYGYHWVQQA